MLGLSTSSLLRVFLFPWTAPSHHNYPGDSWPLGSRAGGRWSSGAVGMWAGVWSPLNYLSQTTVWLMYRESDKMRERERERWEPQWQSAKPCILWVRSPSGVRAKTWPFLLKLIWSGFCHFQLKETRALQVPKTVLCMFQVLYLLTIDVSGDEPSF